MKTKVWGALLSVYIVWGSTYLAIRFVVESIPPFLSAALRFLISGAILYFWQRAAHNPRPARREWLAAGIIGVFMLLGGNGGLVWAEQRIPSGIASLFIGSTPLWMVLIDAMHPGGRKPVLLTWVGVLVGFIGITLLASPWERAGTNISSDALGVGVLLISALCWSIGSLYSRQAPLPRPPLMGTGMEMLTGGAALLLVGSLAGEWQQLQLSAILPRSIGGLAYLIIFGSMVGFVAYTWLLRNAPTPLVSTYAYVNPLVAIFLGSLLGGEAFSLRILFSAVIIIGAVVLINFTRNA